MTKFDVLVVLFVSFTFSQILILLPLTLIFLLLIK